MVTHHAQRRRILGREDVREEIDRLKESKAVLVSLAHSLQVPIPRSCCRHRGQNACVNCASLWLVNRIRSEKPLACGVTRLHRALK